MKVAKLTGKPGRAVEEIVPTTRHTKQAGQLGHDDRQSRPCLEAHENAVADKAHEHTELEQPGDCAEYRDGKGHETGNLCKSGCIASGESTDRGRDHQRDR